jgi:hypothetical protein
MDSRRHRADNSIPEEATASTTPDATPHHTSSDLEPTPNHRPEHTDASTPTSEPDDRPPRSSPADEQRDRHKDPDQHTEPEERREPDRHSPDRSAEPPSTDTQPDPFASYPPELRAHMHHDDTLSRLQYLSNPLPEPEITTPTSQPADPEKRPEPQAASHLDEPAEPTANRPADSLATEPTDQSTDEPGEPAGERPAVDAAGGDEADLATRSDSTHSEGATKPSSDLGDTISDANQTDHLGDVEGTSEPELAHEANRDSELADRVADHDERWDAAEAGLPPGRLPESAKSLDPDTVESLDPDVRRILEYQGAAEYIAEESPTRPWLEPVVDASPAVQRIFTAIDQGTGHAHIRHGPMGDDQLYADRVARLQDPAQTDIVKREAGIDGLNPTKKHRCSWEATRIHDAGAFTAAFAAAVKLPEVHAALSTPLGPTIDPPDPVKVPIADLLGPDGHRYCSGYRLEGGPEAMQTRKEWLQARAQGEDVTGIPEPRATRIESFEGGSAIIRFKPNGSGYEINTLFVEPPVLDN